MLPIKASIQPSHGGNASEAPSDELVGLRFSAQMWPCGRLVGAVAPQIREYSSKPALISILAWPGHLQ